MKNLSLFVIILSSIFLSCEKEETQSNPDQENLIVNRSSGGPTTPIDTISHSLNWATYIVAEILQSNYDLKVFAQSQLDPITKTIPIASLLVADGYEATLFREKFRQQFILFNACLENHNGDDFTCPGGKDNPGPPGCSTCIEGGGLVETDEEFEVLLNYLILENCVEFYFPKGIVTGTIPNTVTAVVHPFSNANTNKGYMHYTGQVRAVNQVNDIYVANSNQTIIVGRPIRTDDQCTYMQYNVDSFITYLEGPF